MQTSLFLFRNSFRKRAQQNVPFYGALIMPLFVTFSIHMADVPVTKSPSSHRKPNEKQVRIAFEFHVRKLETILVSCLLIMKIVEKDSLPEGSAANTKIVRWTVCTLLLQRTSDKNFEICHKMPKKILQRTRILLNISCSQNVVFLFGKFCFITPP